MTVVTDVCRVVAMRERGLSHRAIAGVIGVSSNTVALLISRLSASGQLEQPERVTGRDGKHYAAQRERER